MEAVSGERDFSETDALTAVPDTSGRISSSSSKISHESLCD